MVEPVARQIHTRLTSLFLLAGDLSPCSRRIARLKKDRRDKDNLVELTQPLIVGRSAEGFGLMPYMMTINPESAVEIKMEHILSMHKTNEEITKGYQKQTSKIETL